MCSAYIVAIVASFSSVASVGIVASAGIVGCVPLWV